MEETKYEILQHTFLGRDERGCCTYKITFNRSLDNTIRMQGMCKGLDEAEKKERKQNWWSALKTVLGLNFITSKN